MITKIYFPVANTAALTSSTNVDMSTEDYENAIVENCYRNKAMMDDFTTHGFNMRNRTYYGVEYSDDDKSNIQDYIEYHEIEALVKLHTGNDINIEYFNKLVDSEKMSILSININPTDMDYDVESELNMWIGDSDKINKSALDNQTKMLSLEGKNIKIKIDESIFLMENCKILKNDGDRNNPFSIIIIIEKITLDI